MALGRRILARMVPGWTYFHKWPRKGVIPNHALDGKGAKSGSHMSVTQRAKDVTWNYALGRKKRQNLFSTENRQGRSLKLRP